MFIFLYKMILISEYGSGLMQCENELINEGRTEEVSRPAGDIVDR